MNCIFEVVAALFCLEVDIRWLVCIQVGCVVCISDAIVVLILDVIPVASVDCITDIVGGCVRNVLVTFAADDVEFTVSIYLDVELVSKMKDT